MQTTEVQLYSKSYINEWRLTIQLTCHGEAFPCVRQSTKCSYNKNTTHCDCILHIPTRLSLFFVQMRNFRRKGCGEMRSYMGLVMDKIGQEFLDLLELSASIEGADVECLLVRRGYGGERCIYSFHVVVCFECDLLLKQFCVVPYMRLRFLWNVPGRFRIPKSCQMLDSLST